MPKKTMHDFVMDDLKNASKEISRGSQIGANFLIQRATVVALLNIAEAIREQTDIARRGN